MAVTQAELRALLFELKDVEETISYGTPMFKVRKIMLARLRGDGVLVLRTEPMTRDMLLATAPDTFFLEDHYVGSPAVLVHLNAADRTRLGALLAASWTLITTKQRRRAVSHHD
jgi:hypothetical protein